MGTIASLQFRLQKLSSLVSSEFYDRESHMSQSASIRGWMIWLLGALFFFSMYIPRVATGVIASNLMQDFAVSAGAIGTLTAFYFYAYLIMQVPVGMLVDRFNPRILLTIMIILCGISCVLFAKAESLGLAELSRALLGFSAAFAFVGALKLAAEWLPFRTMGLLTGLTQSLGMLGAMVGEHPIAVSVATFGWRNTYLGMAAMFFILATAFYLIVKNPIKKQHLSCQQDLSPKTTLWQEAKAVFANPQSWIIGLYAGFLFAPTAAFAEQWGNFYLQIKYGFQDGALGISLIFAGWAITGPVIGWLSSKMGRRKPLMLISALLSLLLFSSILYLPVTKNTLFMLMFLFGVCNTGLVLAYASATEINSRRVAGTSLAIANMMSILIGALFQPLIGFLMDFFATLNPTSNGYNSTDLQYAMTILPGCLLIALFLVPFIRETYGKPLESNES